MMELESLQQAKYKLLEDFDKWVDANCLSPEERLERKITHIIIYSLSHFKSGGFDHKQILMDGLWDNVHDAVFHNTVQAMVRSMMEAANNPQQEPEHRSGDCKYPHGNL